MMQRGVVPVLPTRGARAPGGQREVLRGWHRRLAWVVGPWLLMMALSGVLLALWPAAPAALDPATGLRPARPGAELQAFVAELHAALAWPLWGHGLSLVLSLLALAVVLLGTLQHRPRRWQEVFRPTMPAAPRGRWLVWHRACGWWLLACLPPLLLTGAALASAELLPWSDDRSGRPLASSTQRPEPTTALWAVGEMQRLAPELQLHRVRLHEGLLEVEARGSWGLSAGQDWHFWFDSATRSLVRTDGPADAGVGSTFLSASFAWHTGRWAGPLAWAFNLAMAAALLALVGSAFRLWWLRRGVS